MATLALSKMESILVLAGITRGVGTGDRGPDTTLETPESIPPDGRRLPRLLEKKLIVEA